MNLSCIFWLIKSQKGFLKFLYPTVKSCKTGRLWSSPPSPSRRLILKSKKILKNCICVFLSLLISGLTSCIVPFSLYSKYTIKGQSLNFLTFKEHRNPIQGINSASLCGLAGRYENPIPTCFLAPRDCLKITAQSSHKNGLLERTRNAIVLVSYDLNAHIVERLDCKKAMPNFVV